MNERDGYLDYPMVCPPQLWGVILGGEWHATASTRAAQATFCGKPAPMVPNPLPEDTTLCEECGQVAVEIALLARGPALRR